MRWRSELCAQSLECGKRDGASARRPQRRNCLANHASIGLRREPRIKHRYHSTVALGADKSPGSLRHAECRLSNGYLVETVAPESGVFLLSR